MHIYGILSIYQYIKSKNDIFSLKCIEPKIDKVISNINFTINTKH